MKIFCGHAHTSGLEENGNWEHVPTMLCSSFSLPFSKGLEMRLSLQVIQERGVNNWVYFINVAHLDDCANEVR